MKELNPNELSNEERREGRILAGLLENLFQKLVNRELGLGLGKDSETGEWSVLLVIPKEDQTPLIILGVESILLNGNLLKTRDFLRAIHSIADEAIEKVEGMKRNN